MGRAFIIEGREFADPDPRMTPDEVRQHFANFFPELNNATTNRNLRGEDEVYTFEKTVGRKGTHYPMTLDGLLMAFKENIENHCPCQIVYDGKDSIALTAEPLSFAIIGTVKLPPRAA